MASINFKAKIKAIPYSGPSSNIIINSAPSSQQALVAQLATQPPASTGNDVPGDEWRNFDLDDAIVPSEIIDSLDNAVNTLETAANALTAILNIIQLFLSNFNSFSSILSSLLNFIEGEINKWLSDLGGAGVYLNFLIPPSFSKNMFNNQNYQNLSTGGFNGFLSRLQVSLRNTADQNRPTFSDDASVGGMILLIDAESFDEFFRAMKQFNDLFDIEKLFSIVTEPGPPRNIRSYPLYSETEGFRTRLQWDAPLGLGGALGFYRISRHYIQGGELKTIQDFPDKLYGKDGFINAIQTLIASGSLPLKTEYVYNDPDFNGGEPKIVGANPINGSGSFIDEDIPTLDNTPTGDPVYTQYYYTIEFGWPTGPWGQRSSEHMALVEKACIDPEDAAIVTHAKGFYEYISSGWGGLGSWSSIQAKFLVPFLPSLIAIMNKLLSTLKGMLNNATSSFSSFIRGIQEKIQFYVRIINALSAIVIRIKQIFLGGNFALLYLPPKKGGISNFMNRVRTAQRPDEGFSGSNGITGGLVIVFGEMLHDVLGDTDKNRIKTQTEALDKIMRTLGQILSGKKKK